MKSFLASAKDFFSGSAAAPALVLLLDCKFLPGAMGLLASLMRCESLKGASVVVLTTDRLVMDFPLIRTAATEALLFSPEDLNQFKGISRKHVLRSERHSLVPKYTLLKFNFFRSFGHARQLFLDCDMIVMRPLEEMLEHLNEWDFLAAPALPHNPRTSLAVDQSMSGGVVAMNSNINSGMMAVSERLLAFQPDIISKLISLAEAAEFSKEQQITSSFLRGQPRIANVSVGYNFLRSYANRISEERFRQLLPEIHVLHYISKKPWLRAADEMRVFDEPWNDLMQWAEATYPNDWQSLMDAALEASSTSSSIDGRS